MDELTKVGKWAQRQSPYIGSLQLIFSDYRLHLLRWLAYVHITSSNCRRTFNKYIVTDFLRPRSDTLIPEHATNSRNICIHSHYTYLYIRLLEY